MRYRFILLFVVAAHAPHDLRAQGTRPRGVNSDSAVFARARSLVVGGNGSAGRLLIDSVMAAADPNTPAYAEALYWRATLAVSSADAEHDYRRLVAEYPLSPRIGDALLQLSQLEVTRGDRTAARQHLERFLLESPNHPERSRAELKLVQLSFEQQDLRGGCVALTQALQDVPANAIETRNQLDYYSPRCVGVDTSKVNGAVRTRMAEPKAVEPAESNRAKEATPAKASTSAKPAASGKTETETGHYTLQLAAYGTRPAADALAKKLKARGLQARVVGKTKPFRVRVGSYATRTAANAAARELKAKKIGAAFVTERGADDR